MKAKDFISEVFNSDVKGQLVRATNDLFATRAEIGGRTITFSGSKYDANNGLETWEVAFMESTPGNFTYGKSGSGQELQVFSFIIESLKELVSRYSPEVIEFTSDKADGNRSSLYKRMATRIKIPGYHLAPVDSVGPSDYFRIVKDKS